MRKTVNVGADILTSKNVSKNVMIFRYVDDILKSKNVMIFLLKFLFIRYFYSSSLKLEFLLLNLLLNLCSCIVCLLFFNILLLYFKILHLTSKLDNHDSGSLLQQLGSPSHSVHARPLD